MSRSLGEHRHEHTLRVGICCESPEADVILQELQQRFGNRTMMHRLRVPGAACEVLEVFDPAVSKWEGINFVIRRHQISPAQVIAVGDDMNDLQMIRHSGLGVAMGNSRPALKQAADLVIGASDEDGLAVFHRGSAQRQVRGRCMISPLEGGGRISPERGVYCLWLPWKY